MEQESSEKVAISDIPKRLFKYYKYDPKYNESRLSGEVFLSSPKRFNDPFDCQLEIKNNAEDVLREKKENSVSEGEWLVHKLIELGYQKKEVKVVSDKLLKKDEETTNEVYDKQLQKIGILCTTSEYDNMLMWSYYTELEGFCIEYDPKLIIHDLTIGFIKTLDYYTLNHLYNTKKYHMPPSKRSEDSNKQELVETLFNEKDIEKVKKVPFFKYKSKVNTLNFIKNIYIKRVKWRKVDYNLKIDDITPFLFYNKDEKGIIRKYYTKSKDWKHEEEFRFFISLGGDKLIQLSPECIKAIYCGVKMSDSHILEIAYLLHSKRMDHVKLLKMETKKGEIKLKSKEIEYQTEEFKKALYDFSEKIASK